MPTIILVIGDAKSPVLTPLTSAGGGDVPPGVEFLISNDPAELIALAPRADAIVTTDVVNDRIGPLLAHAPKVRWAHSLWTGVERALGPALKAHPVPFSNGKGAFRGPLGDWVAAIMLHFAFDFPRVQKQQRERMWDVFYSKSLVGQTLGIVGYGGLGSGAAERAKQFGMKVAAVRRNPEKFAGDPNVDVAYSLDKLNEMIASSDFLLLATPLTEETRGMIGREQIAAMKPNAVVINIGRGAVIDEPALVEALRENKIKGAALDVFVTEPLPEDHPFWTLPNVFVSPHTADRVEGFTKPAVDGFLENLRRFVAGGPLLNLVDKNAGY